MVLDCCEVYIEVGNPLSTPVSLFHSHFLWFACIRLFFDYLRKKKPAAVQDSCTTALHFHSSLSNCYHCVCMIMRTPCDPVAVLVVNLCNWNAKMFYSCAHEHAWTYCIAFQFQIPTSCPTHCFIIGCSIGHRLGSELNSCACVICIELIVNSLNIAQVCLLIWTASMQHRNNSNG